MVTDSDLWVKECFFLNSPLDEISCRGYKIPAFPTYPGS
jgi:hypothetical protein